MNTTKYINKLKYIIHRIEHLLGWNTGHVETWHEGQTLVVGFRCDGCGELSGEHPVPSEFYNDKPHKTHEQTN